MINALSSDPVAPKDQRTDAGQGLASATG